MAARSSAPQTLRHMGTPSANPPAGSVLLYFKSDGLLYRKNSAGVEALAASGLAESDVTGLVADLAAKVAKSGDTMTGVLELPSVAMTPTVGTAKGRFGGLPGVEGWVGMFENASFNGSAWILDDTTKPGWFFKLDSRAGLAEFAVYRIPAGANPHSDEAFMFKVDVNGLMTVMNRITGVSNATGATDALPKGQADALYAAMAHNHTKSQITDLGTIGTAAALNVPASGDAASGEVVKGNDSRMTNSRAPTAHNHGIADLPVAADGSSSSTQVVRSTDSRLSNARTPTAHAHATSDVTGLDAAVDTRIAAKHQTGTYTATGLTANVWNGYSVTFPVAFASAPNVTVSYAPSALPASSVEVRVGAGSPSSSGFTLYVWRNATTSTAIAWTAVL